ncbi:hypothetical protein ACOMHN_012210 [Nucella lapillus]
MSSAYLHVKALLLREGMEEGVKEIRRFQVDGEESGGVGGGRRMQSLLAHIHTVFNVDAATQRCTLYWKDEDGDLIEFSSEEELSHALESMQDGTFRLYVTLTEGDADQPDTSDDDPGTERRVTFGLTPEECCTDPASVTRLACPGRGRGHTGRKGERTGCRAKDAERNKEFKDVRLQVPAEFRRWVRQYVRAWYTRGPEAAQKSAQGKKLPEVVPHDFPLWLHTFLHHHPLPHPSYPEGEMGVEEMEGEMGVEEMEGEGLEGLPPVYFRWLTLFLPRFHARFSRLRAASADSEGEEDGGACCEGQRRKSHKGHGKHGCHGKKGGKHGGHCSSSESEESDSDMKKAEKQVPKEFRKYARVTVNQLHKNKGNNSDNKEKATQAGVSAEVQEFVEQTLLEWHAKMANKRPRAVATEMMAGERSLPAGMEVGHFLWLCCFLARWHRRHARKCSVMSGWSSGDTTTDDTTSGEDTATPVEEMQGDGPWPRNRRQFRAIMKMMRGHRHGMMGCPNGMMGPHHGMMGPHHGMMGPHHGMMGPHHGMMGPHHGMMGCPNGMMGHPRFSMHPGMGQSCFAPPRAHAGGKRCGRMGGWGWGGRMGGWGWGHHEGCKRWKEPNGASQGEATRPQDDAVRHVTEGVKKM